MIPSSLFLSLFFLFLPSISAYGVESVATMPANNGSTGLFDLPTARIMEDWNLRLHYSRVGDYTTGAITVTFLPRLEVNGRITDFSNVPGLGTDKAIDFKINMLREGEFWPALTIGATDIHGTALFSSRYVVVSKFFGPLDLTLGLGQGILAGEDTGGPGSAGSASEDGGFDFLTSGLRRDTRFFGGLEFRLTEDLSLVGEYSSLDYEEMRHIEMQASSPINVGIKYRLGKNLLSLSYQQGREFSGSYSAQFPLRPEGMLAWKKKPFWSPAEELRQEAWGASNENLALLLRHHVAAEGFSNVRVSAADAAVWVEIENPTYLSHAKALGRALRAISALVPPRIEWVSLSLKHRDIIVITVRLGRQDFEAYIDGRLDTAALLEFMDFDPEGNEGRQVFLAREIGASPLTAPYGAKKYTFALEPRWNTYFNDYSAGFLRNNVALVGRASYFPWAGGYLAGTVSVPLYNDIPESYSSVVSAPEQDPVRTDSIKYLSNNDVRLETLTFDQLFNLPASWLGRAGAGFFESAYGGVGLECFRFFQDGRLGIGLESQAVKKRHFDNDFKFQEGSPTFKTAFLNIYYKLVPTLGLDVGIKLGRFLAGDTGGRVDISRTYRYFTMGAWYTVTNTDVFTASYNQGYHDKGIYLVVPFSVFKDHDNPLKLFYSFRPWGRDTGQTVRQGNALFPMASSKGNIDTLKREMDSLKD